MLEVVFDDSFKGSMKMAKNYKSEGEAIGGSSHDVVCTGFALDVGDITCDIDSEQQKNKYAAMFEPSEKDEIERYFSTQREDYEKLLDTAKSGGHIRIWKSNAPFTACGFAFLCDSLRNIDCKISVIELPGYYHATDAPMHSYINWSEIQPGHLYKFLSVERETSIEEKSMNSNIWRDLKTDNAPLRALVNGNLISVPEDFYDHIIYKTIPDGEFTMGQLIGTILWKYPLGVGDWWYFMRIKKMITENKLAVVGDMDKSRRYGKILKRV